MKMLSHGAVESLRKRISPPPPLEFWDLLGDISPKQEDEHVGLLLLPTQSDDAEHMPRIYQSDRESLVKMAKKILRDLEPTPEQEILATLRRIESLLEKQA